MSEDVQALADALWAAPIEPDLGYRQNCDALAAHLVALGYRLTHEEHTHHMVDYPPGVDIDADTIERMRPLAATHRRRVYRGSWERMPDGEHVEAESVTFGAEP